MTFLPGMTRHIKKQFPCHIEMMSEDHSCLIESVRIHVVLNGTNKQLPGGLESFMRRLDMYSSNGARRAMRLDA